MKMCLMLLKRRCFWILIRIPLEFCTCCYGTDSQSCCTRSIVRCTSLVDLPVGGIHRYPPRNRPCHCKVGHLVPSGTNCHIALRWRHRSPGSVVHDKARSTHIGRRPESRGRCSQDCFPRGFPCSYTHLWGNRINSVPNLFIPESSLE